MVIYIDFHKIHLIFVCMNVNDMNGLDLITVHFLSQPAPRMSCGTWEFILVSIGVGCVVF